MGKGVSLRLNNTVALSRLMLLLRQKGEKSRNTECIFVNSQNFGNGDRAKSVLKSALKLIVILFVTPHVLSSHIAPFLKIKLRAFLYCMPC